MMGRSGDGMHVHALGVMHAIVLHHDDPRGPDHARVVQESRALQAQDQAGPLQ
jgi:hypothetical protein